MLWQEDEEHAIGSKLHDEDEELEQEERRMAEAVVHTYSQGVMLGVTFGTAVGGMATLIGCGPNVVMPGLYHERFPEAPQVTFLQWFKFAMPLAVPYLILQWLFLCWYYCPSSAVPILSASLNRQLVEKDYESLGTHEHLSRSLLLLLRRPLPVFLHSFIRSCLHKFGS